MKRKKFEEDFYEVLDKSIGGITYEDKPIIMEFIKGISQATSDAVQNRQDLHTLVHSFDFIKCYASLNKYKNTIEKKLKVALETLLSELPLRSSALLQDLRGFSNSWVFNKGADLEDVVIKACVSVLLEKIATLYEVPEPDKETWQNMKDEINVRIGL